LRVCALIIAAFSIALTSFVTPVSNLSSGLLVAAASSVVLLLLSSERLALDLLAPARSHFRRVRRTVEVSRLPGEDGYRDHSFGRVIVIDDEHFDVRALRNVLVLVILTDERGKNGILRRTEFAPAMLFEGVAYELDRFSKAADAQSLANVLLSACSGKEAVAATRECPPWNPYREPKAHTLVRTVELTLWALAPALTLAPLPRAVAAAMMVVALFLDVGMTRVAGRRMGAMRTALIREHLPAGFHEAHNDRRSETGAAAAKRRYVAPPAKKGKTKKK
jgi:hypothetical protein